MSRHPGKPTDDERDAAAEAFYADGVGLERCRVCHQALRATDGEALVSIRLSDIEEIVCLLEQYVDCPEVWAATITRLEQACGRTVAQICAAERLTTLNAQRSER
jgi:hypothetical protein